MKLLDLGEGIKAWESHRSYILKKNEDEVCDFPKGRWEFHSLARPPALNIEVQSTPFVEEPDPWIFRALYAICPPPEKRSHCLLEMLALGYIGYDDVGTRQLNCKKCLRGVSFKGVWWNF